MASSGSIAISSGSSEAHTESHGLLDRLERRERQVLAVIVVGALALRLISIFWMGTIDSEGAEYARIAENLVAGHGYVGLVTPGKNLIFPPLYPFMIALVTALVGQAEVAGRLISSVMGSLLAVPVYLIAREIYGRRTAPFAAAIVALHPMLVGFAASVYCESTYMALQLSAIYLCLRVFRQPSTYSLLLTGALLGASYLVRPEAGLYAVLASGVVAILALARGQKVWVALRSASYLFAVFAVLALPYVVWLHGQTGQWRLEGKSSLNYATERLIEEENNGMYAASYEVTPALVERGIWLKSHSSTLREVKIPPGALPGYLWGRAKSVSSFIKTTLVSGGMMGAPLIFVLSVLGLFGAPWSRRQATAHLTFFCVLSLTGSALFFIYYLSPRYLITCIPFLSIWASSGVVVWSDWLSKTVQVLSERRNLVLPSQVIGAVVAAGVALGALSGARGLYELRTFAAASRPIRDAGEWLDKYAPGEKVITDSQDTLPFHARAQYVPLPYADSATALRYLRSRHVRFVALHDLDTTSTPFLANWVKNGVPAPGAELIYNHSSPALGRILIYELKNEAGDSRAGASQG
jgi:4-amino-4-deoxy-L-arabinose transferase-like glycosyltransferase